MCVRVYMYIKKIKGVFFDFSNGMMMQLHFCATKMVLFLLVVILKEVLPSDAADPDIILPVTGKINVIPGFHLWCKVTGTPPINHTALMWNNEVLPKVNSTDGFRALLKEEGNYTCTATSQLGTESKSVQVTFTTCPYCSQAKRKWYSHLGNTLDCEKVLSPKSINCSSTLAEVLYIHKSDLRHMPGDMFKYLSNLKFIFLASNNIHKLEADLFSTVKYLRQLDLSSNKISVLEPGLFSQLIRLSSLNLSSNNIAILDGDIFSNLGNLTYLSLSFNNLTYLNISTFAKLSSLQYLDISNNQIEDLPDGLFCCSEKLKYLFLQRNNITAFQKDTFSKAPDLRYLFLSHNNISGIPDRAFFGHQKLELLMLSDMNMSGGIGKEAFKFDSVKEGPKGGLKMYMIRNQVPELRIESFYGLKIGHHSEVTREVKQVSVVRYLKSSTREERLTIYLNPTKNETMEIDITAKNYERANLSLVSTFLDLGFRCESNNTDGVQHYEVEPCPTGHYSMGIQGCEPCPPGGFMSDTVSFVSEGCNKCPRGTSVRLEHHPGKKRMDCKACPQGTDTGVDSNKLMACQCLPSFHRKNIFGKCFHCRPNDTSLSGLNCSGDYLDLKQGYWWYWKNETHRMRFKNFSWNIITPTAAFQDGHGQYVSNFTYPLPEPIYCPRETSCPGGWKSIVNPCVDGYEGPVCGLCSPGYYRQVTACRKCPTGKQILIKLGTIGGVFLFLVIVVLWFSRKRARNVQQRPMIDKVFSRVRIIVICYQTHYAMLEAFKFVTWHKHIEDVVHYSDVLQLNFLQIVPMNCLFPQIKMDAFGRLFGVMILNAGGTLFFGMLLRLSAVLIWLDPMLTPKQRARRTSNAKGLIYKFLFFFLFVNYFLALSQTANVFPINCRYLCLDRERTLCDVYLKTDYSVRCTDPYYRLKLIAASLNIVYLIGFPAFCVAVLWRSQWVFLGPEYKYRYTSPQENEEVITGLSFLYEPYRKMLWWWELVDLGRKVALAFGLILFGREKRLHIGLAATVFSFYAMTYTLYAPLEDFFENSMMTLALTVSFLNIGLGSLSRIPKEEAPVPDKPDPILISYGFMLYVYWVNTLVLTYMAAEYYMKVMDNIIMWWRRPYLSIDCCQAVLLPYSIDLDFNQPTYKLMDDDVDDQDFKHQIRVEYGIPEMPSIHARALDSEWLDNIERGKLIQDEVDEYDLLVETNCKDSVQEENVDDNSHEPDEENGCRFFKDGEFKVSKIDDEVFDFDMAFGSRFLSECNIVGSESTVNKPDNEIKDSPVSFSRREPKEANVESTKSAVTKFGDESQEFDVSDKNGKLNETGVDDSESAFNKADDKIKESPMAALGGAPIETNVEDSECRVNKVNDEIKKTPVAASSTAPNETELEDTETATTKCDDKSHHFNEAAARETIVEDRSSVTKAHVQSEMEGGDTNDETKVGREEQEAQTELTLLGVMDDEEIRRMGFLLDETLCDSDMKEGVNLSHSNMNSRDGDIQTGPNDVECTDETCALLSEHDSEPPQQDIGEVVILSFIDVESHDSDWQAESSDTDSTRENGTCQSDIAWGVNSMTDDLKSTKDDFKRKTTNEGWENDPFQLEDNLKQPTIRSVDAKSNQDAIYEEENVTCKNGPDVDDSLIPDNARVNWKAYRDEDLACENESLIPVNASSYQDSFSGEDNNEFQNDPDVDGSLIPDNAASHQNAFCGENNNASENDQDVDYSLITSSHQDALKGEDNDAFENDPGVHDSFSSVIALSHQDSFCGENNNACEDDQDVDYSLITSSHQDALKGEDNDAFENDPDVHDSFISGNCSSHQDAFCGEDNNTGETDPDADDLLIPVNALLHQDAFSGEDKNTCENDPDVDYSSTPVNASLHQDTFCGEDNDACENDPDVDDRVNPVTASSLQENACENDPDVDGFSTFY